MAVNRFPDFQRMSADLLRDARIYAEKEGVDFFVSSFDNEGFTDSGYEPWQKRKEAIPYKVLQQTAYLKNSVQVMQSNPNRIVYGSDAEYGEIHNEGGTVVITVTPKSRKFFWFMFKATGLNKWKAMALTKKSTLSFVMPQRQFIGESITFMNQLDNWVINEIQKRFKTL